MNAMIESAWRWKPGGDSEDIFEVAEQGGHQVCGGQCVHDRRCTRSGHPMPIDTVIIAPATHARVGKIPEDWTKSPQPLNAEYHLIAHHRDSRDRIE
jgi:hypothetical protein